MFQSIIVALIVVAAAGHLAVVAFRRFVPRTTEGCGGCGNCQQNPVQSAISTPQLVQLTNFNGKRAGAASRGRD
ncbi:MAG: FeoB-associated Cys-rich membrane protein [Pirellulales bacterium]|nr:FeoB-associated Cys-rich membrane protein [Pirellulales bacterium]